MVMFIKISKNQHVSMICCDHLSACYYFLSGGVVIVRRVNGKNVLKFIQQTWEEMVAYMPVLNFLEALCLI